MAAPTQPAAVGHSVAAPAKTVTIAKVTRYTTTGLNLRKSATATSTRLATLPKGTKITSTQRTTGGWYRVSYAKKTGWVSGAYLSAKAPAKPKPKPKPAAKKAPAKKPAAAKTLTRYTTTALNLRKSASASSARLATLPKGTKVLSPQHTASGWYKVSYAKKTGWVSGAYLSSKAPAKPKPAPFSTCRYEGHTGTYTSTSNGVSNAQRYYTKRTAGVDVGCGTFTVPAGTPVWKVANSTKGRWKVNVGGVTKVLMRSTDLARTSPAATTNRTKISLSAFKKLPTGAIPEKYLARIGFSTGSLIGAPAVADLNALNKAFKKRFGSDLYVDLGYRTKSQQQYYYKVLGSKVAAKPGTSVHEHALSIDLPETSAYSWNSARYAWMIKNGPRYGWVHPARLNKYTASGKLNPYAEYWHFDYVGKH